MKNGVRIRFIGDRSRLPADVNRLIEESEARTRANARLTLIVAMSYGSRQEIVAATRAMARAAATGKLDPEKIDEDAFARHLETADVPDPDLVIRTSGEKRVSNFLLWQLAYSELIFIDTLWPDFARADLEEAIREFHRRERRYGATAG
jgi:undecaprenyl diphosphate synthase